jgi:hypothetical protein
MIFSLIVSFTSHFNHRSQLWLGELTNKCALIVKKIFFLNLIYDSDFVI